MSYETMKINDICTKVTSGGTPKSTNSEFYNPKEIPWLKTGEVNYCRLYDTETYISKEGLARSSAKLIPENSVIIAMYGQGDTAGRVAINKIPLSTNQACCNLIINHEIANYEYVYYALSTLYDKLVSLKNGGAQPNLNAGIIKEVEIPFPELVTQKKIASILSTYDYLIENNHKQIKLLEESAQRLYKEWFMDLHFPRYEDAKVVDGVPEGWTYKRVEEFGEVITGKTPSTAKTEYYGGSIPFVTIPDMHGTVFPLVTEKTLTKVGADTQKSKYLPANTVIVSCIATVGLVNIAIEPCQTNQQINSVILHDDNSLYFFYESMKRIKALLDGVGSNGATMTNVNKTKFSNIKVLCPTEDLVMKYNEFCKPIFDKILMLSKGILVSKQARDRLLPKLMSGEIEV
uniref:restriction endonuclease subunit S n=1 Tax=Ruminococcus bromii TaxID=40518 RepID=UPI003FEEE85E